MMQMGNMIITDDNKTLVSQDAAEQLKKECVDVNGKKPEFTIMDAELPKEQKDK
jgi:hypothetical protein